MKILLSGMPGIGKSTILEKVLEQLRKQNQQVMGCIVKEMQTNQVRSGFKIHYFPSSKETVLASCEHQFSSQQISKFSVNIDALENELIPFMHEMSESKTYDMLIFDEIGRMQSLSPQFIPAVDSIMHSNKSLIATIVYDDEMWARKYKDNQNIFFIVANQNNRDFIATLINRMLLSTADIRALKMSARLGVSRLFKKYMANDSFLELAKLFEKTVKYLANDKAKYNAQTNSYDVFGDHFLRKVSAIHDDEYTCTCEFYLGHEKNSSDGATARECSHIQTVSILRNFK